MKSLSDRIQLSIADLAGGVALSTVPLRTPDSVPAPSIAPVGIAASLNLTALVLFVDAYIGFTDPSDAYVGPNPAWIAEKAKDEDWTFDQHILAQVERPPSFFEHNRSIVESTTKTRREGIYCPSRFTSHMRRGASRSSRR